jgi:hypothetical protein
VSFEVLLAFMQAPGDQLLERSIYLAGSDVSLGPLPSFVVVARAVFHRRLIPLRLNASFCTGHDDRLFGRYFHRIACG